MWSIAYQAIVLFIACAYLCFPNENASLMAERHLWFLAAWMGFMAIIAKLDDIRHAIVMK